MAAKKRTNSVPAPKKKVPQKPVRPQESERAADAKLPFWQRPLVWIGSIFAAMAAGAAGTFGTGLASFLFSPASSPHPIQGPPVRIEAVGPMQIFHDYTYVLPYRLVLTSGQLGEMNSRIAVSSDAYQNWFVSRGGVQAGMGYIPLTIVSNYSSPVTIRELDIVKQCQEPLTGGTLFQNSAGAGPFPIPAIDFDLDQGVSIGQYGPPPGPGYPSPGGNFFAKEAITLSPRETPQTLNIFVSATRKYCTFSFQMHVITDKGETVESITDKGRPFRLTATGKASRYRAVYMDNAFQPPGRFTRVKSASN